MRCYVVIPPTYACNQWEFNTSNINVPCMLTNPKDQGLAGHAITKLHLNSFFFDFVKLTRTSQEALYLCTSHRSKQI